MNIVPMFVDLLAIDKLDSFMDLHAPLYDTVRREKEKGTPAAEWYCDTYNTLYSEYNLLKDARFQPLLREIADRVLVYSREFGVEHNEVHMRNGWINLAAPGAYQEYHIHPGCHFSIVYYSKLPENSGHIVFQSNKYYVDMYNLPVKDFTPANFSTFRYEPKEGDLIIFRSHIPHMVTKNNSQEDRVSISINYYFEEFNND